MKVYSFAELGTMWQLGESPSDTHWIQEKDFISVTVGMANRIKELEEKVTALSAAPGTISTDLQKAFDKANARAERLQAILNNLGVDPDKMVSFNAVIETCNHATEITQVEPYDARMRLQNKFLDKPVHVIMSLKEG